MVITFLWVDDKNRNSHFLEEAVLLADINMNVGFKILFLTLGNVEVKFNNRELK